MMRERAEAVGARLSITSQSGHSTELIFYQMQTRTKGLQSKE
jgi:nitrate/nitrite-specific signal transduction histidine kinase